MHDHENRSPESLIFSTLLIDEGRIHAAEARQQQHGMVAVEQPSITNSHGFTPQSEIQINVAGASFDCFSKIDTDKTGVHHPFNILSPHRL